MSHRYHNHPVQLSSSLLCQPVLTVTIPSMKTLLPILTTFNQASLLGPHNHISSKTRLRVSPPSMHLNTCSFYLPHPPITSYLHQQQSSSRALIPFHHPQYTSTPVLATSNTLTPVDWLHQPLPPSFTIITTSPQHVLTTSQHPYTSSLVSLPPTTIHHNLNHKSSSPVATTSIYMHLFSAHPTPLHLSTGFITPSVHHQS